MVNNIKFKHMKKTYLTPTAETVTVQKMLMQNGSPKVTSSTDNLGDGDHLVIGGPGTGSGRSNAFSGFAWDDSDYEE